MRERGVLTGARGAAAPGSRTLARLLRLVAAAAVLVAAAVQGRAAGAGTIERSPEFVQKVNAAIDQGVVWLRAAKDGEGAFPAYPTHPCGVQALAYHTLRVCGVPKDDPDAVRAWASLRREYTNAGRGSLQTYTAALLLMAIAEHGERVADPKSDREVKLSDADRAWAEEVTGWLVRAQGQDGTWTYGGADDGPYGRRGGSARNHDHSNTQYALLGLKAAARCGIDLDAKVWLRSLQHFLDAQDAKGAEVPRFDPSGAAGKRSGDATSARVADHARGWGYQKDGSSYGSMTAGGVGSVVICRSELLGTPAMTKPLEARSETSLRDGLAWLGLHFTVRSNPGPRGSMAGPSWHFYYLYALERAGVLAGVDWMADHDWYGEGAEYLCGVQSASGGWNPTLLFDVPGLGPGGRPRRGVGAAVPVPANPQTVLDTCFALLFLKKGTLPVRRGALTQAADDSDIRFDRAASLTGQDFEDFLDLVLLRWRRTQDDGVRARLFERATAVGPRIVEPLLFRLDAPEAEERAAANALLRRATGRDFGFDAAASRELREAAVQEWQLWWMGARTRIVYDPAERRLVDPRR